MLKVFLTEKHSKNFIAPMTSVILIFMMMKRHNGKENSGELSVNNADVVERKTRQI